MSPSSWQKGKFIPQKHSLSSKVITGTENYRNYSKDLRYSIPTKSIQYQLSSLCPRRKCSIQGNTCSRRIWQFRMEREILLSTELLGDRRKKLQTCIWLLSSTGCGYRIQGSSLFSPPLGKETCSAFEINHLPPASKET